jgi:hypothetical protein
MFRPLASFCIWLLWFGGAALIMHLDARRQRRKAVAEQGEDFVDRRILPYMLLAVLCGALPLVIYFGATRKGTKANGVLLGLGVLVAHLAAIAVIGGPLFAAATWLDTRGERSSSGGAELFPGQIPADPAEPAWPSTAGGTPAAPTSLPPPAGPPLTRPPSDIGAEADLSVALEPAAMGQLVEARATKMSAALDRLAVRCAAGKEQVIGAVPPDLTGGLEADPKVVELVAECAPASGSDFGFAPLRGNVPIPTLAMIYNVKVPGGLAVSLSCPSQWSDDPRAVDLSAERKASGLTSRLRLTVLAEQACPSAKRLEQERKKQAWLRSLGDPFRAGLDQLVSRASCPSTMDQFAGGPSPAKGTSLEADGRVLEVKVTCWWDRGGSGQGFSYRLLRGPEEKPLGSSGSGAPTSGDVWTLRASQGGTFKVCYPSMRLRSKDAIDLTIEQPLGPKHKLAIELTASVK